MKRSLIKIHDKKFILFIKFKILFIGFFLKFLINILENIIEKKEKNVLNILIKIM